MSLIITSKHEKETAKKDFVFVFLFAEAMFRRFLATFNAISFAIPSGYCFLSWFYYLLVLFIFFLVFNFCLFLLVLPANFQFNSKTFSVFSLILKLGSLQFFYDHFLLAEQAPTAINAPYSGQCHCHIRKTENKIIFNQCQT